MKDHGDLRRHPGISMHKIPVAGVGGAIFTVGIIVLALLGLPIAKSLIDMHGGTFTLKSKLRIGTEVIVTFPPERVMSALAPMSEEAPPLQPENANKSTTDEKQRARHKPIMSAGTGL